MTDAAATFQAYAADYDQGRLRLVPQMERFYAAAARSLELVTDGPPQRLLDLGAGTGLFTAAVLATLPGEARVVLQDGAPAMLAQAEERLGDRVEAAHVQDFRDPLPGGPFDAVVSSMAIHHLEHADQAALYARVAEVLRPGGVFVNAEIVAGPTAWWEERFGSWHERAARERGTDDAEWAAALERFEDDRCASVPQGLAMFEAAGLEEVCCPWADGRFAVLAGRRPA